MTSKKSTKSALLTSSLALLLCFSMLLGTTFAWFTDTVTSANNIIKSGNLDIELDYWNGTTWKTVQAADDILAGNLWEPGYVDVAYLRLKNNGSLSFKYQFGVNIVSETKGVNVAGEEFKLSDYIYFDVAEGVNGETNAYDTREDAMSKATETTKISKGYTKVAEMKANSEPVYLAMVVYMPETVGNEANHNGTDIPQIDLGLNVVATQLASEEDSFGTDYDNIAFKPVADVDLLDETNVKLTDGTTMNLDVAYSFKTTENDTAAAASGYRYYHADFVVSASKKVKANSIALAGYYDAYAQATNTVGQWIALTADEDIAAGTEIRLMEFMGVTGNYEELCNWIPEFLCGAKDLDGSNKGNTLNVELRLYETYSEEECLELFGYKSKNEETGKFVTIGVFEHTFGGEYKTLSDGTGIFKADDNRVKLTKLPENLGSEYVVPVEVNELGGVLAGVTLDKLTINSNVDYAYKSLENANIDEVVLENGISTIPNRMFYKANVGSVVIPSSVTKIEENAFAQAGVKTITIPASVTTIEMAAFAYMPNLETVYIESSAVLPQYAFRACPKLKTVVYSGDVNIGSTSMIFSNYESGNKDDMTFYVTSDENAEALKKCLGAYSNSNKWTVIVGIPNN